MESVTIKVNERFTIFVTELPLGDVWRWSVQNNKSGHTYFSSVHEFSQEAAIAQAKGWIESQQSLSAMQVKTVTPHQKLRVWWVPQVVGTNSKIFTVEVTNLVEAKLILDTLANYDLFQYHNHIKGNYCNTGGLEIWNEDDQEWEMWWDDEDTGREIDDYTLEELRKVEPPPVQWRIPNLDWYT
jgi:hypothetical protein